MANYEFDELSLTYGGDTYVFTPDVTLTKAGSPADAGAVKNELTEIKADLSGLGLSVVSGKLCMTYDI